jgi:hypothetical protein
MPRAIGRRVDRFLPGLSFSEGMFSAGVGFFASKLPTRNAS